MKLNTRRAIMCALASGALSLLALAGYAQEQRRAANNMFPQWSFDGKKIAFTSDRDGDPEIYVMNADGSNPVRLTHVPGRDAHPYFSRDGRKIVFQSPRANGVDTNIYLMDSDGSNVRQLTNLKGFAGVPEYSPDEKLIVFQWRETNNFDDDKKWRICMMNADGSNFRVITSGAANDQVPDWTSDGKRLLFYSDRTGKNQIYNMAADGSDVRRQTDTGSDDHSSSWSPDNMQIAFTSDRNGNSDVYVMDANGQKVRRLTNTPATERGPHWSPDGKRIVFSADGDGPSQVYSVNADGSNLVCLTAAQNPTAPVQAPAAAEGLRSEIRIIEEALSKIPDRGSAIYSLAKRYAILGESAKALSLLKECITLDEGFDPTDSPALQSLKSSPEFRELAEQARRRYPPVSRASVAFTISEMDLFPEGMAADASQHVFYMGSIHYKKIVRITETGAVSDFVKPDLYSLASVLGIKVESTDHSVWAAAGSELVHFDAQGKLLERFAVGGAGPHLFNDLVLRNLKEIYVTDTPANQVYRFDRKSHSFTPLTFPRPLFSPNGIALSDTSSRLYVADAIGVFCVDLKSQAAHEVNPGRGNTLAAIDGLYWHKGALVAVQAGTNSNRVMRGQLSSDGLRVVSAEILEHRTPLVSAPTTGAIAGGKFYFIANTGNSNLRNGKIVDPTKLRPVQVAVVPLE